MAVQIKVGDKVIWAAFPRQADAMLRQENEILYGGARGGGKTAAGMAWLLMGNPKPVGSIADSSYVLHPRYRALTLRRNVSDLSDWIAKAKILFGQLGATYTQRPNQFVFPSGATIVLDHLDDEDAFSKYMGQEFQRIVIEELTQIHSLDLYLKVKASNRSPFDELRCQMLLTSNPGGVGMHWVRDRFVVNAKPNETYKDPISGNTRIYIPARIVDNPIYASDREYVGHLMELSPTMRRAWLDGDWDAIGGAYFSSFRTKPNDSLNEPPEARHVWHSTEAALMPWYHKWLSVDWGYSHQAATYKYAQEPDGRIHVVDELCVSQTTPEELGLAIGRFIWPDLQLANCQKQWSLYLSPDAFGRRTEERTVADQIAIGIQKVLGSDSVYIMPLVEGDERDIFSRASLQGSATITIERAPNQRIAGWMHLQSLLRWWPIAPISNDKFDTAYALALHRESPAKYQEYLALFDTKAEILPQLVIHGDKCPELVRAIPLAVANDPDKGDPEDVDKRHFKGMDSIDSLRYGCFAAKFQKRNPPWEDFWAGHLAAHAPAGIDHLSGDSKVWMARKAEAAYATLTGADAKPIHFNVSGARARRGAAKRPH